MASSPHVTVRTDKFTVEFLLDGSEDLDTIEEVDATVIAPNGGRRSASLMTLRYVQELMERRRVTGEGDSGHHFRCHDLVLVREGGLDSMVRALVGLFDDYRLEGNILPRLDD
ncbi:hypothetical protein ACLGI4_08330 [Streptomyces sp. HMX112]|uniref:hypothetical protein n=1 Tax=Streptomyces sp. HMX112 TaxID=3390850 RepID=UPI003A80FD40